VRGKREGRGGESGGGGGKAKGMGFRLQAWCTTHPCWTLRLVERETDLLMALERGHP